MGKAKNTLLNLLYSASLDVGAAEPLDVIGVVLGGATRDSVDSDVLRLLGSIRNGFHDVPLATHGQLVGSLTTPWGAAAQMVVSEGASIFTWSDTPITATMGMSTPSSYDDGEVVGTITWTAGPNTATAEVEIEGTITPPTSWWRLTHPFELARS